MRLARGSAATECIAEPERSSRQSGALKIRILRAPHGGNVDRDPSGKSYPTVSRGVRRNMGIGLEVLILDRYAKKEMTRGPSHVASRLDPPHSQNSKNLSGESLELSAREAC